MMRIALTEFRKTPKLQQCDPVTVISAIVQAAQLGLEPGSGLGHCFLVPYWNKNKSCFECQLIPGYKGLIDLARRSGQVADLSSRAVYVKDKFEYEYGLEPKIIHKPYDPPQISVEQEEAMTDEQWEEHTSRGRLTHVYAVVKFKNGGSGFEVMSRREIQKVRDGLKNTNPIWVDHFDEMARKTVVRRLAKYMPLSPEFVRIQELDDASCQGESQEIQSVAIEAGIIDATYKLSSPVSADAETPADTSKTLAKEADDKNRAAMVKILKEQIAKKVAQQKGDVSGVLFALGYHDAKSIDEIQFENFPEKTLAAIGQTLREMK